MAGGLIALGKRREKERIQAMAKEPAYNRGLVALGQKSNTEKNQGGIPGAVGYLGGNVFTGASQMVEGIVDLGMAGADLIRGDTDMAQYRFVKNVSREWDEELEQSYNPGKMMKLGGDVASGIGTSLLYMIPKVGIFVGAAGTLGSKISDAAARTGKVGAEELGYGAVATIPEVLLQYFIGAGVQAGKSLLSAGSKAISSGTAQAGVRTAGNAVSRISRSFLGNVAWGTAKGMIGEGVEEATVEAIDPFLLRLFNVDENAEFNLENVLYAGLVGALSGGLMTSGPAAINYKSSQAAGRMIREAGLTDAFLEGTHELLRGADRARAKADAAKNVKVTAEEGTGVRGKVSASTQNAYNWVKQRWFARSAKKIAETTRKNLQSFEQFNAKENKTASEQAIADAMLGELRGNVHILETSYLGATYEQAILDATPEQKQEIVDFINRTMAANNAAKSDYTVADLDADTDGILTSMAAKYVEADRKRYRGIRRVDTMEGRGKKDTETAEEVVAQEENAATEDLSGIEEEVWRAVTDETVKGYGTQNEQEEALLRTAVSHNVPEKSIPLMLERFREGTDMTPAEFADAWADGVLFFGRLGLNEATISQESALSRMSEKARRTSIEYGKYLLEEQRAKEQEAAKKKKRPVKEGASRKPKGKVVRHPGINLKEDLDDAQFTAYKAAEIMAPALKADIEIHKGLERNGKKVNGYYDKITNTFHINIDAVRDGKHIALYTLGHEVTHYIKEWSPKKFYELGDYVMEKLGTGAEKAIRDKLDFLKRNDLVEGLGETEAYDRAYEEVVADGMELVLTDGTVLNELAIENKTLWQKIKDRIFEIIEKIKKAYGDLSKTSRTAQILSETMDSLDDIEQLFYEGVREAGERTRTAEVETESRTEGGKVYSLAPNARDEVKKALKDKSYRDEILLTESTPRILLGNKGIRNLPMTMNASHLRENIFTESEAKNNGFRVGEGTHYHGLGEELFFKVVEDLENATEVYRGTKNAEKSERRENYFLLISQHKDKNGNVINVPVYINETSRHNRIFIDANKIATVFGRDDLQDYIRREIAKGNLVRVKTKKGNTQASEEASPIEADYSMDASNGSIPQIEESVNRKFSISEEIPSTLSAEDQSLLFDADFYERYENESREPITETVEELEATKASEAFATMSDDEAFDLNAKLKAKRAGYDTVYDYYVGTEKERMAEEYRRYVQTGRSNRTSRTLEEKRKKAQKERILRSDVDSATPLQNAQYQIIQETNRMWDEYHTGIRSPKEIKTFAEVAEDPESFTWGDFTREDAQKALRDGTVRVYSSYAIKNGVFVSTSYKQALQYAGNNPDGVHTRVVALDSVAWINGDEGQYAKVYKDDGIRYSIDDNSLVEKYPNLNLNQDISDMDGVPAIQLEDGSVLTFTEPHVTFIQNNGIDVEDIRSGGWIADGVYEPSERSDTLRYKERMLAKKRMDEKRAAKKGDIRYSIDETPETPDVSENRDLTDREILGMALEGAVQSQEEYNIVKSYREQASMLELVKEKRNGYSKEAAALERQIKALRSRMEEEGDPNGFIRKALDEAIAKKRNAEAMRDEQDRILDNSTKELLKLKAAKPFRELVDREGRRAKAAERKAAKAVESADARVERTKQRADKRIEQAKAEYESREKYKDDRREVTTRKRAAQRILGSLNTALYNPTKAKHVPLQLHDLVETTLKSADPKQFGINRDHIREMSELAAKIEKLERKPALTGEEQETLNKMKGRYEHLEADTISVKRQAEALNTAFKQYQKQVTEADMMDKDLMDALDGYVAEIEEATLAEMNLKSLIAVERFYTALLHQVNNSNKTFATEKAVAIDKLGTDANTEVKEVKALKFLQPRAMELAGLAGVRGLFWNNMKPLTVFDAIGSETFAKLFKNVMDGEDVWATDLEEAHEFLQKTKKEYGYDKWDLKKRSEITTADGTKVALTLGEKMSLYAYMFREQAEEHLSIGGFTFAPDAKTVAAYKDGKIKYEAVLNDQKQYHMRKEDIVKMAESLTEEQRAYAEAVQKYLTSLGKKGNEVSVKLYGLELFNETAYFPIKSNRDYLAASTGKSGDPNIKSRGTFKETVPDASNPIVLEDFMEVTINHINTMATYHAFVLPIEDLTRVWNYTPVNIKRDENGEAILDENGMPVADTDGAAGYNSLKAEITKKYGAEANDYIQQLIRDLNGGARRDAAATILDKGLTAFKRAATTMSASTIIQQPTSVIRAMAYVDAKHFRDASFTPWETVKKYAKVAFIKEMGGFDTGTGARTQEFLNQREYDNIGQKVKAAVTPEVYGGDPQARAEFFGWLTYKADETTWRWLFGAITNEQAERLGKPKDSEEVLKAAGDRFTEVVRRTQVYDSTLTRSQNMRSKDGLMKTATAFMAEPTTVVSMAADAVIRLERGDKMFFRKTAAGIAGSIILNAMAVSMIYAMRDDDEDKNIIEKYISSLTGEIVEGFNPLEYFPILRDIMSLFKGYEIERSDMTLINNLLEQVELITSSKRSFMDKMIGVTGAVAAFFGIPVTNVYRDVKGLTTTTVSLFTGEPVTAKGTAAAAWEGVTDQFGLFKKLLGGDRGTSYELYRAKVSGDKSHYTRVAARYDSPEAEEQALRRELRENDKRIGEAAEARRSGDIEVYKSLVEQITDEGIFDRGMVIRAIQTEMNALSRETEKGTVVPKDTEVADEETVEVVSLYSSTDLNAALERGDTEDFEEIYESMISDRVQAGKTEAQAKSAVKSSITAYWKPRYIEARNANDTETMKKILQILLSSGLYGSRNDVAVMLEGWIKAYAKSK